MTPSTRSGRGRDYGSGAQTQLVIVTGARQRLTGIQACQRAHLNWSDALTRHNYYLKLCQSELLVFAEVYPS